VDSTPSYNLATQARAAGLPPRGGDRPRTFHLRRRCDEHRVQVTQNAPPELQLALLARTAVLPGVGVSERAVGAAHGFRFAVRHQEADGCVEFALLNPPHDGSLHVILPCDWYRAVLDKGWGEAHTASNRVTVYGPRNDDELEVVWAIVLASYRYATASWSDRASA
jgi:hypothetical protein